MASCGCNAWNTGDLNTQVICGDIVEPVNPDEGACLPGHYHTTCERPTLPPVLCDDVLARAIPNPSDPNNPFLIVAGLFDQDCEPIQDQNGYQIETIL